MERRWGLIFDVDGVIADSESVNVRATMAAFVDVLGISGMQIRDFEAGIGRGAAAYVKAGAAAHGSDLSAEQVERLVHRRQENFISLLAAEGLPAYPGVEELVEAAMSQDDWGLAIATSSTREKSQSVLEAAGIPWREIDRLCGDDVTHPKPDPELFSLACQRLELSPAHCVVVEDAPAGVEAALAAGCACIAVTNTQSQEKLARAHLVVDSLADVTLARLQRLIEESTHQH